MINKDGKIPPVFTIAILILFSIGLDVAMFVGMLYLFEAQTAEMKREQQVVREDEASEARQTQTIIDNQNKQIGLLTTQLDRGNTFRNQTFQFQESILRSINETVSKEFERNANLTAEETKEVVDQIRLVFNTTIPQLNNRLENLTDSIEQVVDRQANNTNQLRNFAGIQATLANVNKVLENQEVILQRIDNNTLVANSTVTAID